MDNLNTSILLGMPLLLPPLQEQRVIAQQCALVSAEAEQGVQALTKSLGLLHERKQALVTVAVTGQLDVTTARSAA